jgi:uncharacterized lipoprotein YddW (UPF0748 family)
MLMPLLVFYCFFLSLFSCNTSQTQREIPAASTSILPKREFRGVWIATVVNIDWPSKPGLSAETQKNELIQILDKHQSSGINAVMLQIRPTADAFYSKGRELWSRYLTGKQGTPPAPFYDPLDFAINEAHKRGMELHAWFNPYRATFDLISANTSNQHITRLKPQWFFTYDGKKLFNPGIPQVRDYIVQVVMDVVKNYDIDGIHFDDYFYPYPVPNRPVPDTQTYKLYGKGFSSIGDWRRNNVDLLIHTLSDSIHAAKKYVKFGISPFGIWKNIAQDRLGSESAGGSSYLEQFADSRKWVQEGWVDYINPQIYWPFGFRAAPFEKMVEWWSNNAFGRHLYIGQGAYRAAENREGWRDHGQIPRQVRYLRNNPRVQGSVFFSSKSLRDNLSGVNDSLQNNLYRYPALPPLMPWLDSVPPQPPYELKAQTVARSIRLSWKAPASTNNGEAAYGYVIYKFKQGEDINIQNAQNILKISFDNKTTTFVDTKVSSGTTYIYLVTALDRLKNESSQSNQAAAKL